MKVFVFSTVHNWDDGRIFYREVLTLAKYYAVEFHAVAPFDFREENGVPIYGLPQWHSRKDRIASIWIVWKRILKSDADVFHFHDPELLLLAPWIALLKRKPMIFDAHENWAVNISEKSYWSPWFSKLIGWVYAGYERAAASFLSRIIYTTPEVGRRYRSWKGEHAIEVGNFPSLALFDRKPKCWKDRRKVLVITGFMTPRRGIFDLVAGFRLVVDECPDYRLLLLGHFETSKFENDIRRQIVDLDLENYVTIRSTIPYTDLPAVLEECRIGYIPFHGSGNHLTCIPNKLVEFMSAGMPVIASDFPHYREVVEGSKCGIMVPERNPQAIADATKTLICNEAAAQEMGMNGKQAFIDRLNWETQNAAFLKCYHELALAMGDETTMSASIEKPVDSY